MKTQIFFVLQLFLVTAFTFSCGEDEGKEKLSFKNQDVQGEMFGEDWMYEDGNVYETEIEGQNMLSVALYAAFDDDVCKGSNNETGDDEMGFYVPPVVGVYKLKSDTDFPMLHVAMINVDSDAGGFPEIIFAYEGSIEILTITETEVTGRVVARHGKNIVNGNFDVPFCLIPEGEPLRVKSH